MEMPQRLKYEVMLRLLIISEICYMIQRINSIQRPDEKIYKSTGWLEMKFPESTLLKSSPSSQAWQKKILEFTDSIHIIY